MSTKDFRSAVFAEIDTWQKTHFPTIPAVYENGPVPDEDRIGPAFLDVSIRWYGSTTLSIGESKKGRHRGVISVLFFMREGQGTATADEVLDHLSKHLSHRHLGQSTVYFPEHYTPTNFRGWYKVGLMFPFTLDI